MVYRLGEEGREEGREEDGGVGVGCCLDASST